MHSHPIYMLKVPDDCMVLGLLCLTSLSTIFQLYRGSQFYWWRKPEAPEKNNRPATSH